MPRDPAYGTLHIRARERLLRETPPGTKCRRCGKPMYPGAEPLDCAHASQAAKAAGLPGDHLEHSACNRSEYAVPPQVRAARARAGAGEKMAAPSFPAVEDGMVARRPGCRHLHHSLAKKPAWSCPCDRPLAHHIEILAREKRDPGYSGTSHAAGPCPVCEGWSSARIL
jgi:hypothetical protein